jgi:hypothetical protein
MDFTPRMSGEPSSVPRGPTRFDRLPAAKWTGDGPCV